MKQHIYGVRLRRLECNLTLIRIFTYACVNNPESVGSCYPWYKGQKCNIDVERGKSGAWVTAVR